MYKMPDTYEECERKLIGGAGTAVRGPHGEYMKLVLATVIRDDGTIDFGHGCVKRAAGMTIADMISTYVILRHGLQPDDELIMRENEIFFESRMFSNTCNVFQSARDNLIRASVWPVPSDWRGTVVSNVAKLFVDYDVFLASLDMKAIYEVFHIMKGVRALTYSRWFYRNLVRSPGYVCRDCPEQGFKIYRARRVDYSFQDYHYDSFFLRNFLLLRNVKLPDVPKQFKHTMFYQICNCYPTKNVTFEFVREMYCESLFSDDEIKRIVGFYN